MANDSSAGGNNFTGSFTMDMVIIRIGSVDRISYSEGSFEEQQSYSDSQKD